MKRPRTNSHPRRWGNKKINTQMLVVIIISKYQVTSTRAGYAPRNSYTRAKVLGLKESQLSIRGDKARDLVTSAENWTSPSCSPHRLVSQSTILKEESLHWCRGAKYKTYCLLDDPWVILSTSKAFYYCCFRGNEITCRWAPGSAKFVNKITVKGRVGDSFC